MKKIIIDLTDYKPVEVSKKSSFGRYRGINSFPHHRLSAQEQSVRQKLASIALRGKLPQMVTRFSNEYPALQVKKMNESINVLQKIVRLMNHGFHSAVIDNMLRITVGESIGLDEFQSKFEPLYQDEECRKDFWGTEEIFSCALAKGLLADLMNNVDVDNPSQKDLQESETIKAIKQYK